MQSGSPGPVTGAGDDSEQSCWLEGALFIICSDIRVTGEKAGRQVRRFTHFMGGRGPPDSGSAFWGDSTRREH